MTQYHLAEVNIARMLAPIDDPIMADFVARLEEINRVADGAEGFVWRLQTEDGDATALRVFDDQMIIVNMSVWESPDALFEYTYHSQHIEVLRRRADWFEKMSTPILVMWWIPAGHIPTVEEARAKLDYLQQHGATPLAFTFKQRFSVEDMLQAAQ